MSEEQQVTYKNNSVDLTKSPLLNRPIKERNYDVIDDSTNISANQGIQGNHATTASIPSVPQPPRVETVNTQQPTTNTGSSATNPPPPSFNPPPSIPPTDIPPFTPTNPSDEFGDNDEANSPSSDAPLSNDGFKLPDVSAKQFSNIIVESYSTYGTKVFFNMCKIDMNNVAFHVQERNIRPQFVPLIEKANTDALTAIKPTDEEKLVLKRALKDYLGSINAKFANPQNSLLVAAGLLIVRQIATTRQLAKENKELLMNMIEATSGNNFQNNYTPTPKDTVINK